MMVTTRTCRPLRQLFLASTSIHHHHHHQHQHRGFVTCCKTNQHIRSKKSILLRSLPSSSKNHYYLHSHHPPQQTQHRTKSKAASVEEYDSGGGGGGDIEVIRNVRYSNNHPNNILDIYKPSTSTNTSTSTNKSTSNNGDTTFSSDENENVIIYLHGGLWMRGGKEDSFRFTSNYDLASTLLRYSYDGGGNDSGSKNDNDNDADNNTDIDSGSYNDANKNKNDHTRYSNSSRGEESQGDNYYEHENEHEQNHEQQHLSNIGMTFASQGMTAYIANYRLIDIHNNDDNNHHNNNHNIQESTENQTLDVAKAILYVLKTYQKKHKSSKVYIVGYSAGAHLTSLVLSQSKYIKNAYDDTESFMNTNNNEDRNDDDDKSNHNHHRNVNNNYNDLHHNNDKFELSTLLNMIHGYIGISGPYNLKRLNQSTLRDITIGPVFMNQRCKSSNKDDRNNNDTYNNNSTNAGDDIHMNETSNLENKIEDKNNDDMKIENHLMDSSPLHVILQQWKKRQDMYKMNGINNSKIKSPLLTQIPVLLLNAETDFHLHSDSKELLVALSQFDDDDNNNNDVDNKNNPSRKQCVIPNHNHLSITWEFGSGYIDNVMNVFLKDYQCTKMLFHKKNDDANYERGGVGGTLYQYNPSDRTATTTRNKNGDNDRQSSDWNLSSFYDQATSLLNYGTSFLPNSFHNQERSKDLTATKIFAFIDSINNKR